MRFSVLVAMLFVVSLGGCATRPGPELLRPVAATPQGSEGVPVFAVTNRDATIADGVRAYGDGRGENAYEEFTIAVAPAEKTEKSDVFGNSNRDLAKDFVTLSRQQLGQKAFSQKIAALSRGGSAIVVFVHGYNQSFQEALFRTAQLAVDARIDAVPILFSWPSEANLAGYVADRDGATFARDDLVALLKTLGQIHPDRPILLVGHSLGSWLVMEALRQLRLEGQNGVLSELEVALAAPDIDVDVFRKQASVVGKLAEPITVLVSPDDHALGISAQLAEERPRLGAVAVDDPATQALARETGIRVFDIGALPTNDGFNHDRYIYLATLYGASARDSVFVQRLQNAGTYILDGSGAILTAPTYILTGAR